MFQIITLLPKKTGPFEHDPDWGTIWHTTSKSFMDAWAYHRIRQAQPNHLPVMAELGVTFAEPVN